MRLTAFDTYALFLALKQHFTQASYDFFKYSGKIKVSANKESFIQRKDKYQFQRLSRLYDSDEMTNFLVSNFLKEKIWIGDFLDDDANDNYLQYLRRKQSLAYVFTNEVDDFFSKESPQTAFKVGEGYMTIPPILNYRMCNVISVETYLILDDLICFSKIIDKKLKDDFLWTRYNTPAQKFRPFLEFDREKMKTILKEKLHEHSRISSERQEARSAA